MTVFLLGSPNTTYGTSETEFRGFVKFACDNLGIPDNVTLFFEFEHIEEIDNFHGFVHDHDCGENEFFIVLSPHLDWAELVRTIFHELVHVRQSIRKDRLGDSWKGAPVNVRETDYHNLPWEIEAYSLEDVLYNKFVLADSIFA